MINSKTYFIKTFGCQMNETDSQRIAGWYEAKRWKPAKSISEADEIVINTCSVRESAEHRVLGFINNLAKRFHLVQGGTLARNIKFRIILTGCMLYHPLRWLREKLPEVDEFKPIKEFNLSPIPNSQYPISTLVSIMEGCNRFCSYCVVPYSRGREKSRPFEEIICQVKELVRRGVKEITLLGQNVNSYGKDFSLSEENKLFFYFDDLNHRNRNKTSIFSLLLRVLNNIDGIEKISFLTSNPWGLIDEIIEAMKLPKIDRYLHLPVQSGDDEILRRMNRHYTAQDYLNLVKKIRQAIPDIKIGTDIIVGFPGETEKQFQNTVDLCKKAGFVKAYIAKYSPRPGTTAYKLKDDVSPEEKKRRWRILEKMVNAKK